MSPQLAIRTNTAYHMDNVGVAQWAKDIVLRAIKDLLETKHLYQYVNIDIGTIHTAIREFKSPHDSTRRNMLESANHILHAHWITESESTPMIGGIQFHPEGSGKDDHSKNSIRLILPPIKIPCCNCDAILPPHNSGFKGAFDLSPCDIQNGPILIQILFLPYQCQSCRGEPIIFVVRREGSKLLLVGRSQFEKVDKPDYIPKAEVKYYDHAVIAFNCGRKLAGLFYLRVMVEQYLRRILNVKEKLRSEALCEKYSLLLADDFPRDRFPSIQTIYDELSAKIHAAEEDEKQFVKSKKDIENHFDVLRLFPLKSQ